MVQKMSFNIQAELYENTFGELAIRFADENVYRGVGTEAGARFPADAEKMLKKGVHPSGWKEMTPRELENGPWRCITLLGYLNGDEEKPGVEMEVPTEELGPLARTYLADLMAESGR
jgi:hypothetical protein